MGLKDFDGSKIESWRYDSVGTKQKPQEFMDGHSGTRVDGTRDLILEKFLDNPQNSKLGASDYDLDSNTYPFTPPQSFVDGHFGTTVTGIRDIISSKFVNDAKTLLIGNDTLLEPNINDTPLNPLTQQQNYTVTNPAGEYTITGLKGAKIPGWELQKGLSLILTNWSDMVDAKTDYNNNYDIV